MSSAKGRLLRLLSEWMLDEAVVEEVEELGASFRLLRLAVATPPDGRYQPGDKLQLLLPDDAVRTYTPIGWAGGYTRLVAFHHGEGPGARWARSTRPADALRYLGPRRSLRVPPGPAVIVGDETSLGVAAAVAADRPDRVVTLLEVGDVDATEAAAQRLGLVDVFVVPRGRPGARRALAVRAAEAGVAACLTGGAELVRETRTYLRELGAPSALVKTYWAPGREGLD